MQNLNLKFLGFEDVFVIEQFKKNYKDPNDLYNLEIWEKFENENLRIFAGMYQFWCKK